MLWGQNVMNRDFSEIGNLIIFNIFIFNIFKNVMGLAFFWWLGSENFRDICSVLRPTHTHQLSVGLGCRLVASAGSGGTPRFWYRATDDTAQDDEVIWRTVRALCTLSSGARQLQRARRSSMSSTGRGERVRGSG